jgi:signal transduction histidine kinase
MRDSWEIRFEWIQTILQWVSLTLGVGLTLVQFGTSPSTLAASAAVTGYTIAMQFIPSRNKRTTLVGGLLALLGVVTSLFAIAITGGLESGFLIYLAVPVFFAAAFHGTILGVLTTFAAIAGLVAVATASGAAPLSTTLPLMIVFYGLIGGTFSQARRILIEEPRSASGAAQLQRIESAHHLLEDLTNLTSSAELNPITIGRAALRDLAVTVPYAAGSVAIIDDSEEIVVASRGQPGPADGSSVFPIAMNRDPVGSLSLWPLDGQSFDPHASEIDRSMQGVALSFANVLLLQSIAHRVVREERVRLARELHDDIGPSLVSIGLGLDLTLHTGDVDAESRRHLESMREAVGEIVEEMRDTVAHLRSQDTPSLLEHAHSLAADTPASGPSFVVDLETARLQRIQ